MRPVFDCSSEFSGDLASDTGRNWVSWIPARVWAFWRSPSHLVFLLWCSSTQSDLSPAAMSIRSYHRYVGCEENRCSRRNCLYCHADYRRVIGQRRVIGDPLGGDWGRHCRIAEYSRSIHGLGANDVPSFLSVGSALGIEVVLTALFLYVIFNATSSAARPGTAGLAIGGVPLRRPLNWCTTR